MKVLSAILLTLAFSVSAYALPTVTVDGIEHYLADSDDSTGEIFESADGYCVQQGYMFAAMAMGAPMDVKPLVRLDSKGNVISRYADTKGGNIWVVTDVTCQ